MAPPATPLTIAYVSDGSLFVWRQGEQPRKVESAFARQVQERVAVMDRKHAWKGKGRDARYRQQVWGRGGEGPSEYHYVHVSDVCAQGDQLIYALQSGSVSGVFRVAAGDPQLGASERRLFHTTDLAVADLGGVEQHGYLVCSLRGEKIASHIAVLDEDGSEVTELTTGDSVDCAPSWLPGRDRVLVYQTAGIYRNERGELLRFGPSVLQQLDIAAGELAVALELPGYDLLAPKVDAQGTLFCLKRRYREPQGESVWALLVRALTSPFWLLYALIVWLGVFIQSYTGKRMVAPGQHAETSDGPVRARVQQPLVDDKLQPELDEKRELEPWIRERELIRCGRDGTPEPVAHGIVAFDLTSDGQLVCSDGRSLFTLDAQGHRSLLLRAREVSALCVVG